MDEIGPSLRWVTAKLNKVTRATGGAESSGSWAKEPVAAGVGDPPF